MRVCWRATRPFYANVLRVRFPWPRSSAAATIGTDVVWRGATLRSSTRRARSGASSTWRGSCLLSVVCFIRRRAGLLPPGDVASTAWGSTRRHAAGLRVGVPDPGPRPRRAEVASAGAASLPAEPWVVRGRCERFDLAASAGLDLTTSYSYGISAEPRCRERRGSNAFRRAREEPSSTDSTHATSAADGCPSPQRASTEEPNSGP